MVKFVGRLPNSSDMMMTLMFAANRTTTDVTSTSTSLQITTMEFYKLSCVFVCGYRYITCDHGFDVRRH